MSKPLYKKAEGGRTPPLPFPPSDFFVFVARGAAICFPEHAGQGRPVARVARSSESPTIHNGLCPQHEVVAVSGRRSDLLQCATSRNNSISTVPPDLVGVLTVQTVQTVPPQE
jgi:hypothetical protein